MGAWLVLLIGVLIIVIPWTAPYRDRRPRLARALRLLGALLILAALSWPFLVGRWIFDAQCKYLAGHKVEHAVDAREEGVFDARLLEHRDLYGVPTNYFVNDIAALASGRFKFLEVHSNDADWMQAYGHRSEAEWKLAYGPSPYPPEYERFFLADEGSRACTSLRSAQIRALAPGKCLARESADVIKSRYELRVRGYHPHDSATTTRLVDRNSGHIKAVFRSFNHFNPLNFVSGRDGVCPRYADLGYSPHHELLFMTLLDRTGNVMTLEQLALEEKKRGGVRPF